MFSHEIGVRGSGLGVGSAGSRGNCVDFQNSAQSASFLPNLELRGWKLWVAKDGFWGRKGVF